MVALALGCATQGCKTDATQLVVIVDSDYVSSELDGVEVTVARADGAGIQSVAGFDVEDVGLPFSFAILPYDGDPDQEIDIRFQAVFGGAPLVERRVITSFTAGRSVLLPIFLSRACAPISCGNDESCDLGECRPDRIEPGELAPVDPGAEVDYVFPPPADAGVAKDAEPLDAQADAGVADGADVDDAGEADAGGPDADPMDAAEDAAVDTGHDVDGGQDAGEPDADEPDADEPDAGPGEPRLSSVVVRTVEVDLTERMSPAFDPDTTNYGMNVGYAVEAVIIEAVAMDPGTTIMIGAHDGSGGVPTPPIPLNTVTNIAIDTMAFDGSQMGYSLRVDRRTALGEAASLTELTIDGFDQFGQSIALDGDTLVVGAPLEDSPARGINGDDSSCCRDQSGAVYVFRRNGSSWNPEAFIKSSNSDGGDNFGSSVAIDGDVLAVGAWLEDGDGSDPANNDASASGAVYIFRRTGTIWVEEAYLKASNPDANDNLGATRALALSGTLLAVGAQREMSSAVTINGAQGNANGFDNAGAVYVFRESGGNWSQEAYLKPFNTAQQDRFGAAVAAFGDTVVVAADGEDSAETGVGGSGLDNSAQSSGAVYVFRNSGGWLQEAYLKASNTGDGDRFGFGGVSLAGDRLVVGAPEEDSDGTSPQNDGAGNAGAAYVFLRTGTTWTQEAYLKPNTVGPGDQFGVAVAISGGAIVIGAEREDSEATGIDGDETGSSEPTSGAAYLFTLQAGSWLQSAYVKPLDTNAGDHFGGAVSIDADVFAVGAFLADRLAGGFTIDDTGAAYLFE